MRAFATLVKKEFRDHALSLGVCAVVAIGVSWPVQKWVFKYVEPQWAAQTFLPLLLGLFLVLLASDLFAGDLATRRMDAFALLPVSTRTIWSARVAFVALAGAALYAWTLVANATFLSLHATPAVVADFWTYAGGSAANVAWAALFGAGVLFVSATGVGGFRAAALGAFVATLTLGAAWILETTDAFESLRAVGGEETLVPALVAGATLVLASRVAFVGGRPFARRRRVAFAWGAVPLALLLVPGAAVGASRVRDRFTLEPNSPRVRIMSVVASPDGEYVAMVARPDDEPWGEYDRAWVVRVADGALFAWSSWGDDVGGWTSDGRLCLWRLKFAPFAKDDEDRASVSVRDPETGEVVRTPTVAQWQSGDVVLDPYAPLRERWLTWSATPARSVGDWQFERAKGGGRYAPVFSRGMPAPCEENVVVRVTNEGALVRTDLVSRADDVLVPSGIEKTGGFWSWSPDRKFFLVELADGPAVLDAKTWRRAAGPWKGRTADWTMTPVPGAHLRLVDPRNCVTTRVVDPATGIETKLPSGVSSQVEPLADGACVAVIDEREVVRISADGKSIRRLYPTEK